MNTTNELTTDQRMQLEPIPYVQENPIFNFYLDLWLYCKARGIAFKPERINVEQGKWRNGQ